ncbi:MAG: saccharopine dehydrogenase NADP-binding domain-containing protein [Phycisphaerales bacterium]|nr:MAG: saccharopine dehydrogenase NADP-binding domain-containing protein [Phycisphaerales bacterium]
MGYVYAVFGVGRQGTAAIHDLLLNCEADSILAVEPSADSQARAAARLERTAGVKSRRVTFLETASTGDFAGADVALSCAPYRCNPALTELAIRAGVAFCDLGGNPDTVARQRHIAVDARADLPVVPDCGVSPGLSNILAVHLARGHGADRVQVRCGGIPITEAAAGNPLKYKLLFDPQGLISEYSGKVPVIRAGRLESIDALACVEPFDDGRYECAPTSNNSPQVVEYLQTLGVREYDYMTLRYPGHWAVVRQWKERGFLCGDPAADAQLAAQLASDASLRYDPDTERDRLILSVRGSSPVARAATAFRASFGYNMDVIADEVTRFSAMELTTSWGITIVAYHLARSRGRPAAPQGFATPERFIDTTWAIDELDRRVAAVR